MRKEGTREQWGRVRVIAANLLDGGKAPAEVARHPGVAAQTVREWGRGRRRSVGAIRLP